MHESILPDAFVVLLTAFAPCFHAPSYRNFRLLVAGWIHCLGRRTVTAVLNLDTSVVFLTPEWLLSHGIVLQAEGPNDGVVSITSAAHGESQEVWEGDHLSLVNWFNPLGRNRGLFRDPAPRYGDHARSFRRMQSRQPQRLLPLRSLLAPLFLSRPSGKRCHHLKRRTSYARPG